MTEKPKRIKVYLLLEYYHNEARVIDVYFKLSNAKTKQKRLEHEVRKAVEYGSGNANFVTYHVIKKSIKDSYSGMNALKYFSNHVFNDLFGGKK